MSNRLFVVVGAALAVVGVVFAGVGLALNQGWMSLFVLLLSAKAALLAYGAWRDARASNGSPVAGSGR